MGRVDGGSGDALVSVVIPTYNRADLLAEAMQSVLSQTYRALQLIVVDDGSTDNTEEVVASFGDDRVTYLRQRNSGRPATPRNAGLRVARGDFIAFLDSDDLWESNKITVQLEALRRHKGLVAVATNGRYIDAAGRLGRRMLRQVVDRTVSFDSLVVTNRIVNSSVLFRREVLERLGGLDEDSRLRAIEDYDYWLRILHYKDRSIAILCGTLVRYRIHEANICSSTSNLADRDLLLRDYEKILWILRKYPEHPHLDRLKERRYRIALRSRSYWDLRAGKASLGETLVQAGLPLRDRLVTVAKYLITRSRGESRPAASTASGSGPRESP